MLLRLIVTISFTTAIAIAQLVPPQRNAYLAAQGQFAWGDHDSAGGAPIAPLLYPSSVAPENIIPNRYVVVLKKELSEFQIKLHNDWVADSVLHLKGNDAADSSVFMPFGLNLPTLPKGYAISIDHPYQLNVIRKSSEVAFVEPDQIMHTTEAMVQQHAPWGLARISHHKKPEGPEFASDYVYTDSAGAGVTVYVIDTGINIQHEEFEGRAVWGKTIPQNDEDIDGNGHGTHVAGTIGGKTYGVAKRAEIVAVKVLKSNGAGSMSDVLKGIEWAAETHVAKHKADNKTQSVANMSLGGGKSQALDNTVDGAVELGLHFAVAAGNDNADSCRYSPASSKKSITVLATNFDDARAYFSNWGTCVDIGAPGEQIISSWIGSTTANKTISGTSMASPHVAGVIAALISRPNSEWSHVKPDQLKKKLINNSVKNVISGMPKRMGTKNRLVSDDPPKNVEHHHDNESGDDEI